MSSQVIETGAGPPIAVSSVLEPVREKVKQGMEDRRRFEPVWHSNRAFAAGKQWLKTSRSDRRLYLDKNDVIGGRQRVTVDVLTQYVQTGLGQLAGIEERPNVTFRREDQPSEDFGKVANDGLQYGWDSEWKARRQLSRTKRRIIVDGTAAIQCLFDPTVGRPLGDVPLGDGMPIPMETPEGAPREIPTQMGRPLLDPTHARAYVAHRQSVGQTVAFKSLNEGRISWLPRSVFNIVVPPGLEDEDEFPWVAIVSAASIESLILRYGEKARVLVEEPLAALEAMGLKDTQSGLGGEEEEWGSPGKLKGHVALVQWYGMPDSRFPQGRVVTYAKNTLLDVQDRLPYRKPNGDWAAGIAFFHYWRVEGRFWGRALIEPGKGIQRAYNKRCQQEQLTIDRAQPKILTDDVQRGVKSESGEPMEVIRYRAGTNITYHQGMGPGEWIWKSKEGLIEDLERAMGIHGVSTGDEPSRQTTYAELALRAEKDRTKTDPIIERFQASVRELVEFSIWDMRRYWPADKIIAIEGETGEAESAAFNAQKLPEFFLVKVAEGTKPRDQGAQIQLIFDLYQKAEEIMQPLPLHWLKDSIDAGRPLPLPQPPADVHLEKAQWENSQMWEGALPIPKDYDPPEIHIPTHREAQVEAEMAGRLDVVALIQNHLDLTEQVAAELAQQQVPVPLPTPPPPQPPAQGQP